MFYILQLPQHVLATFLLLLYRRKIIKVSSFQTSKIYTIQGIKWSVSLGDFILVREGATPITIRHEYGHSLQSRKLGWLYLPLVGVPSALLASTAYLSARFFNNYTLASNYYNYWPEYWADDLGGVKR